ncbi:MAG: von Willebrand factor type A domain-containing protein [Chloroflexi bacterium]|nr:von Willebrand factor type A domain-containing protein [Chloroflexota bacterium]MCL5276072.1 von Willebrand factor type A domain-containing protein [Chloroflexota bacterium]
MKPTNIISIIPLFAMLLAGCSAAAPTGAPQANQRTDQAYPSAPTAAPAATSWMKAAATAAPAAIATAPAQAESARVAPVPTSVGSGSREAPLEYPPTATPPGDSTFKDYGVNPFVDTSRDHLSTFGLDVDTASYAMTRRFLSEGNLPPMEAVRAEEFINYFKQDYPKPANVAFGIYADGAPSPFHRDGSVLVRFGVQGYDVPDSQRKPAMLTFIIDVSGSMADDNKLEMVKDSLRMLVERLRRTDQVAIAAFTTKAWVVLDPTSGADKRAILDAIDTLRPMNTTNVDAGLRVGYELADRMFSEGAINRVILCSDGVANTGSTDVNTLIDFVRGYGERHIMLTTVGVGMGTYNDVLLEQLADKGNGFYAYVDTQEEARKLFLERLTGALQTIGIDAKVQVDFNADVVARYRLIGYENRAIADQDFRNNNVAAGQIGAGHTATALYAVQLKPNAQGRIATVQLRWQDPDSLQIREINGNFNTFDLAARFEDASPRYQMSATVAQFAEILRQSPYAGSVGLGQLQSYADRVARALPDDPDVQEFAQLVAWAGEIGR